MSQCKFLLSDSMQNIHITTNVYNSIKTNFERNPRKKKRLSKGHERDHCGTVEQEGTWRRSFITNVLTMAL